MKTALVAVLLVGVVACGDDTHPGDDNGPEPCAGGITCPVGTTCAANQLACIVGDCGNGLIDAGEVCDDGNIIDGDGCSSTCQTAVGTVCGDGNTEAGEECDDGNSITETACAYGAATCVLCDAACKQIVLEGHVCGDGRVDAPNEDCDDGNVVSESACAYGIATCTACNADCSAALQLTGNVCGDGNQDAEHEACDDGNTETEPACPYATASCSICTAECTEMPATGNVCGDGVTDFDNETCDDGNVELCGSCTFTCNSFAVAEARGQIVTIPASAALDGQGFTLSDGYLTITFEFDDDGMTAAGNSAIMYLGSDDAGDLAVRIRAAINDSALAISATSNGALVSLVNQRPTALGNVAIIETVSGPDFFVSGMSGGRAGDCATGQGCANGFDCASGVCGANGTCD